MGLKLSCRSSLASLLIGLSPAVYAQPADQAPVPAPAQSSFSCEFGPMPAFPGDLAAFIAANMHYPDSAREAGIEGRAIVRFLVRKDGLLTDECVLRSSGDRSLDDEALALIRIMPRWTPGRDRDGAPVETWFTLPLIFRLD